MAVSSVGEFAEVRRELLHGSTPHIRRRRTIVVLTLASLATTALVVLRQTGSVKHLPDPPGGFWDTDKVVTSEDGYPLGVADSTVGLLSLAANLPLAAAGPEDRAQSMPLLPIAAAAKSAADATATLWFNSKMPFKLKAWCPYCLTASLLNLTIAALQIPEAVQALRALRKQGNLRP